MKDKQILLPGRMCMAGERDTLRHELRLLRPEHPLLSTTNAKLIDLKAALEEARSSSTQIIEVDVQFIIEPEGTCWAVGPAGERLLQARVAPLPEVGQVIDSQFLIRSVTPGLQVVAGDLAHREKTDPRRIFETANGTRVVFKRLDEERGNPILWSYRASGEIMLGKATVLTAIGDRAQPVASSMKKTQKLVAAWVIADFMTRLGRNPTSLELTNILRDAFPTARISDRHGGHYLSQSRSGVLPEPPTIDPRTWP